MLEVCPSIRRGSPPRSPPPRHRRKGRSGAPRLRGGAGRALNASLVDMGGRMRLIVNEVERCRPPRPCRSSRWPGSSGAPARSGQGGGVLDTRGRRPPYWLFPGGADRVAPRLGRDGGRRIPPHRCQDRSRGAPQGDTLERSRLGSGTPMSGKYDAIREEAFAANLEIPRLGLAILTWGNASAFDLIWAASPSNLPGLNMASSPRCRW